MKLRRELDDILHEEEMLWFQKSRMEAIKDGDRNTKFFHLATIIRRQRNKLLMLQNEENNWVNDPIEVKAMIVRYWQELFTEECPNYNINCFLPGCFPKMTDREFDLLQRPYAECEVVKTIKDMDAFKAPGPDGFQPLFYQRY